MRPFAADFGSESPIAGPVSHAGAGSRRHLYDSSRTGIEAKSVNGLVLPGGLCYDALCLLRQYRFDRYEIKVFSICIADTPVV